MTHDPDTPERRIDLLDVLTVLAHPRRLRVLAVLEAAPAPLSLGELGRRVARAETDGESADDAEVRISLAHVHLPKLDDAGIVRYDRDDRTVAAGPRAGQVRELQGCLTAALDGV